MAPDCPTRLTPCFSAEKISRSKDRIALAAVKVRRLSHERGKALTISPHALFMRGHKGVENLRRCLPEFIFGKT